MTSKNQNNQLQLLTAKIFQRKNTNAVDKWLGEATDLADLENRMQRLDRGQAPFHVQANYNLRGWV